MRLGHIDLDSLQALATQGLLKGTLTCNLKSDECCVLDNKTKVKFGIVTHCSSGLLDYFHIDIGVLPGLHRLESIDTLSL